MLATMRSSLVPSFHQFRHVMGLFRESWLMDFSQGIFMQ